MGPWGFGTFEDELACDWLEDLFDSDPVAFFAHCLDLEGLDYLEYLAGIGVICTSELVHGLADRPRAGLPQAALDWIEAHRGLEVASFLPLTVSAMRRVIGSESELSVRWEDNEQWCDEWFRHASELLRCLENDLAVSNRGVSESSGWDDRGGSKHSA